MWYMTKS